MIATSEDLQNNLTVGGISVNLPTMTDAVNAVIAASYRKESFAVFTLNLSHVVQMRARSDFYDAYRSAEFVTADGMPIAMLGRMVGMEIERTTGSDMLTPICDAASFHDLPVFLMGANETTLAESRRRLLARHHGLRIVGSYVPDVPFDPLSSDADTAIAKIRASGARLCILALGAPRQEVFAIRCRDEVQGVGMLCFGAALDFLAETQERAPLAAQKVGLEWAWRAFREPRRLGPRYLQCLAVLPSLIAETVPQILHAHLGTYRWRH
ncbi:MAG: glycosyl transferase [Proteobacteria bacterium SG_bin9]|nr:MAG: glycosyl transferase [Proteobacteria bacterium SG_bin9]